MENMQPEPRSLSCEECAKRFTCLLIKLRGFLPGVCENFKEDKKVLPKQRLNSFTRYKKKDKK